MRHTHVSLKLNFRSVLNQFHLILDTYDKTIKKLAWDYAFFPGKRFTLNKKIATTPNPNGWLNLQVFFQYVRHILGLEGASFGALRSPKWSAVQKAFIAGHPMCSVCGSKGKLLNPLNVHHRNPFHIKPELELDPTNLITLCRQHHFTFGHLMSWKSWNTSVEKDSTDFLQKITTRP